MNEHNVKLARTMKIAGCSYSEIAAMIGYTRQRIQQVLRPPGHISSGNCDNCGKWHVGRHRHHLDYTTDAVSLLCPSCHITLHSKIKMAEHSKFNTVSDVPMFMPCPHCCGPGELKGEALTGQLLRGLRENSNLGLRQMARLMEVSAPYLSDLERGHRIWNDELIERFKKHLK